jgi:hypothetical protein
VGEFDEHLQSFSEMWTQLHDIDNNFTVLGSKVYKLSDIHRRIILATNCVMDITLNIDNSRALPAIQFTGVNAITYFDRLNENADLW